VSLAAAVIGGSDAVDTAVKWLFVELVVSITEGAPVLARKLESAGAASPSVVRTILPVAMRLMMNVYEPDDPQWAQGVDEDDAEATGMSVACDALYRIGAAIRTKKFLPTASELIGGYARRPEWQARHGALIALASIGETIPDDPAQRSAVIAPAVSALSDSHPRVRWAATHAVGQLANDLAPMLQEELHAQILPPLVDLLVRDVAAPRVRAHALNAVSAVLEHTTASTLRVYLTPLMECLHTLLGQTEAQTPIFVKESAVGVVGTCAERAGAEFAPFYAHFMPSLVGIFTTPPPTERDAYRLQVSFLLCTVTLYANRAHNLTRSP
jgi:hypothetical protein